MIKRLRALVRGGPAIVEPDAVGLLSPPIGSITAPDAVGHNGALAALQAQATELARRLESADATAADLRSRIADLEAALGQIQSIAAHERTFVPPPPKHLQVRVVGAYVPGFIESGFSICDDLAAIVGTAGKRLQDFARILDFGCGCGRTTRALKTVVPAAELHGTDIDPEAIGWLRQHLAHVAEFRVAPHRPPTDFADGFFDFTFGISVLTHLPEDMQFLWLEELRRITAPGGYVLLTTSGELNYSRLPAEMRSRVETDGFYYVDGGYGQSVSLPAFYQNTFHTLAYIEREWSKYFEILDMQPARMQRHQDTILMRRSL